MSGIVSQIITSNTVAVALGLRNWQMTRIRIGTRGSPLALAQAHETRSRLMAAHNLAEDQFEIVVISVIGDRVTDRPLTEIGGKGLFTKEIEDALFAETIDLAVHSMKDMPALVPEGLAFGAVLEREDPRDAFVSHSVKNLADLPQGAILGSSSVRRNAQALRIRPDLQAVQFRGNVQTRLRKLEDGVAHGTFLAVAGLNRLGLSKHISAIMEMDVMLPAVAQGAIAIEIKQANARARDLVHAIHHKSTGIAIQCERAFLATLEGSCRTPIAGHAKVNGTSVSFRGQALTLDGRDSFEYSVSGTSKDAVAMGIEAGERVKAMGGEKLQYA
jgi:hydroxymethylbilane synthase